tara:strand:+ start:473 stop:793 length:321 start_codon:yes stop_codon:yes gene_type:complete
MNLNKLFAIIVLLVLINCSKDKTGLCETNPSFNLEVKLIFTNNCKNCHMYSSNFGGVVLEDFSSIKSSLDKSISEIEAGTMPPSGRLNDSVISIINNWICNGALDN